MSESIRDMDAVITWVDGNDPKHRKKWKKHKKKNRNVDNELLTGRDKTRFVNKGELQYCLYSIRKFAQWIRKIFLVTDNQIPVFIDEEFIKEHNVIIVNHHTIFESYEWALPTFNSRTLELMNDIGVHFDE